MANNIIFTENDKSLLDYLEFQPILRSQLQDIMNLNKNSLSDIIKRCTKNGYIIQSRVKGSSGRPQILEITEKGKEQLKVSNE